MAGHRDAGRLRRRARRARPSRRLSSPAASRRGRACPPPAPVLRARSASGRGGDHNGVELGIGEHLGVVRRHACARVARGERGTVLLIEIAEPRQVGEVVEVPRQVRAPVAEADQAYGGHLVTASRLGRSFGPSRRSRCGSPRSRSRRRRAPHSRSPGGRSRSRGSRTSPARAAPRSRSKSRSSGTCSSW